MLSEKAVRLYNLTWICAMISAVAMLVAVVMFLLGTPLYKHIPPSGSALSVFLKITWLKVTCRMGKLGKPVHTGKSDHSTKTPLLADEEDTKQGACFDDVPLLAQFEMIQPVISAPLQSSSSRLAMKQIGTR